MSNPITWIPREALSDINIILAQMGATTKIFNFLATTFKMSQKTQVKIILIIYFIVNVFKLLSFQLVMIQTFNPWDALNPHFHTKSSKSSVYCTATARHIYRAQGSPEVTGQHSLKEFKKLS